MKNPIKIPFNAQECVKAIVDAGLAVYGGIVPVPMLEELFDALETDKVWPFRLMEVQTLFKIKSLKLTKTKVEDGFYRFQEPDEMVKSTRARARSMIKSMALNSYMLSGIPRHLMDEPTATQAEIVANQLAEMYMHGLVALQTKTIPAPTGARKLQIEEAARDAADLDINDGDLFKGSDGKESEVSE